MHWQQITRQEFDKNGKNQYPGIRRIYAHNLSGFARKSTVKKYLAPQDSPSIQHRIRIDPWQGGYKVHVDHCIIWKQLRFHVFSWKPQKLNFDKFPWSTLRQTTCIFDDLHLWMDKCGETTLAGHVLMYKNTLTVIKVQCLDRLSCPCHVIHKYSKNRSTPK
jgi:hypothetical protein